VKVSHNLFTMFAREHRPLSLKLASLVSPIDAEIRRIKTIAEMDAFVRDRLDGLLEDYRVTPPQLQGTRAARVEDRDWKRDEETGDRLEFTRRWTAIEVVGDITLLEAWPDDVKNGDELIPVDSPDASRSSLTFEDASDFWRIGHFEEVGPHDRPSVALYSYIDLTIAEEKSTVAENLKPVEIINTRRAQIEPIVDAIAAQTRAFFDSLPRMVQDFLERTREDLTRREAVNASLAFDNAWKLDVPELEDVVDVDSDVAAPSPVVHVHIPLTQRLSPKSFTDLQRTMRVWADAIERYPDAYTVLIEDRITDLLAATLTATLPGANREVYSRSGKTDLFVQADVLNDGSSSAKVFIAETKWATSSKVVKEAVDPQLLGYLASQDTAAILLLLLRQKDRKATESRYLADLRSLSSYKGQEQSSVEGWPLLLFENNGMVVRVCVAFVHVPPTSKTAREATQISSRRGTARAGSSATQGRNSSRVVGSAPDPSDDS
jgi:hypothetical protein